MQHSAPIKTERTILLVGNPNVGKSVLFGIMTGEYAQVSNYPGTTVDMMKARHKTQDAVVIDLPGTNSLLPHSEVEVVTRNLILDHLMGNDPRVVQVCDAKNLPRALLLTAQLAELEIPLVLVANMKDEMESRGLAIDLKTLSQVLGTETMGTTATRGEGLDRLAEGDLSFRPANLLVRYDARIEDAVRKVSGMLPPALRGKRGISILLLSKDPAMKPYGEKWLENKWPDVEKLGVELEKKLGESLRIALHRSWREQLDPIVAQVLIRKNEIRRRWFDRFASLSMHPVWGVPIALSVLYLVYLFVGVLGAGTVVDFLQNTVFLHYITPAVDRLAHLFPPGVELFLAGPRGIPAGTGPGFLVGSYGLVSMALSYAVAIILPIVGFFFLAFSVMEDSGYLPRLAVVLNRAFASMGLNGKAVLPMILGLGCDTMATITTRTLSTRKERIITTLLLALAIPCSAQLGVILGMLGALGFKVTLAWVGIVLLVMLGVGYLANKILPGSGSDFILEIPPLRRPVFTNVLIKTSARIEWYLKEAVPLFILGTFILWVMDHFGALIVLEHWARPLVVGFLGLPMKASEALLIGFLRRDYGAAGFYELFSPSLKAGLITRELEIQVIVSMVTITLFVPCIANIFVIIREHGVKTAVWMSAFIFPFAILVGGVTHYLLSALWL